MDWHQVIFVLQDNKISQWIIRNEELELCTKTGLDKIGYNSSTYWSEWQKENYFTQKKDVFDALFLADNPEALSSMPEWGDCATKTRWTIEQLSLLAKVDFFSSSPLTIMQGGIERKYNQEVQNASSVKLFLRPSLGFALPEMCMLLCKEHLFLVTLTRKAGEININGIIRYQQGKLQEKIKQIKKEFAEGFNLADEKELSFILIQNKDGNLTQEAVSALGSTVKKVIPLESLMRPYYDKLNEDSGLYVEQFGVNFDGVNYSLQNGILTRGNFSLTGFTIKDDDLISYYTHCVAYK